MDELEKLRKQVADLTAKVKELEEKEKSLKESERRHRLINELVSDRIYAFVINENGEPEMTEPVLGRVGEVTGYTLEESRKVAGGAVPRTYRALWDLEKRPRLSKQKWRNG